MTPAQHQEQKHMSISTAQVKDIRAEFAKLKPVKVTLDGNRSLTVKEAVFALAPVLERMKKRGFDTQEIADKLHEKGIEVKPPTLAKYLNEFRRGKNRKPDTSPPPETPAPVPQQLAVQDKTPQVAPAPVPPIRKSNVVESRYPVTPDIPLDEL
jgi:hypothetical protein